MKLLEFIGYIKLPDDFEGDEIDALQWYVDYRRSGERPKEYHDVVEKIEDMVGITEYMGNIYDLLVKTGMTRGGGLRIQECVSNKWKVIAGD